MIPVADLHCHLLPAWDDGPKDFEESLKLAERFVQTGCKTVVVTPHIDREVGRPERPAQEIPAATEELEVKLKSHGLDLTLVPGGELHLGAPDLVERLAEEPWLTVGGAGRYILIESATNSWPMYAPQLLYRISLLGITPIVAHPERLVEVQKDIAPMAELVNRGVLLQITARSFVGQDRVARRISEKLLQAGLVAVIASDAHNSRAVMPAEAVDRVVELVGEMAARQIFVENPQAILEGRTVTRTTVRQPLPKQTLGMKLGLPWARRTRV